MAVRVCSGAVRQEVDQALDLGQVVGLGGAILFGPAGDLTLEIVAGAAEVLQPHGDRIDAVQLGQRVDHGLIGGATFTCRQFGQGAVPEGAPLDQLHHIEGRADDGVVLTQGQRRRHGKAGRMQGADQPVFAIDRMGRGQQRSERATAQDIVPAVERHPIGRVRLAAGKLLQTDVGGRGGQDARQPLSQTRDVQIAHRAASAWRANSERAMARAWTSSGPSAKRRVRIPAQAAASSKSWDTPPPPWA